MAAWQACAGALETEPRGADATPIEVHTASRESAGSQHVAEADADQPFIDHGCPVPDRYDVDIIRAMVQDPFRILVYWEISEQSITALTQYFSAEEAGTFQIALKLIEVGGLEKASVEVGTQGSYWMMVSPGRDYEFELIARTSHHQNISLMRSNRVHTPNVSISRVTPNESEYRSSPQEFKEIMEASGFTGDDALLFPSLSDPTRAEPIVEVPVTRQTSHGVANLRPID